MTKENIAIEQVSTSLLKPATYNPRKLTTKQEEQLTESLEQFGLVDPILVNKHKGRENIIIGGHQRYKIASKLGYKEVPVVYLDLDEKQEKELNLRLNKNTGEWDIEMLKEFDSQMLTDVGFSNEELSTMWDENISTEDDNFDLDKALKKAKTTKIKPGDMFALGNHRLICEDSTDSEVVKRLMSDNKVNMIYTDPPFNLNVNYDKGIGGKKNYGGLVDDNKSNPDYKELIKKSLGNGLSVSDKDLHVFCYCDQLYIGLVQEIYRELGITNKRVALWIKNNQNPTSQIAFNKCYEPVIYGTINKPYLSNVKNLNEILNKEIGTGNQTIEDILDLLDIWLIKRLPGNSYNHPTEKSPTLHEKALRRCTRVNDIVLDLFAGSGSTGIACEQLKRKCFMVELNPIFCQLIVNRFETVTGVKAKKLN